MSKSTEYQSSRRHILNKYSGVPSTIRRGMSVTAFGKPGRITSFRGGYVCVRIEGEKHAGQYHPLDLLYGDEIPEMLEYRRETMQQRIDRFNAALNKKQSSQV